MEVTFQQFSGNKSGMIVLTSSAASLCLTITDLILICIFFQIMKNAQIFPSFFALENDSTC